MTDLFQKDGFQPGELISPSALSAARGCERKWGFRYLDGWREPEPPLHEIPADATPGRRARAMGKAIHARLEDYYSERPVDWTDDVGRRAFAILEHAPRLDEIEGPPGRRAALVESSATVDVQRIRASADPIRFNLIRDLVCVMTPAGRARLGIPGDPALPVLIDFKSTKDFRWAKTAQDLETDEQGILYPLSVCHEYGIDYCPSRWIYTLTVGETPRARAVDFAPGRTTLEQRAEALVIQAIGLRAYVREGRCATELPANVSHCPEYGWCAYHPSKGGPCAAQRPLPSEYL